MVSLSFFIHTVIAVPGVFPECTSLGIHTQSQYITIFQFFCFLHGSRNAFLSYSWSSLACTGEYLHWSQWNVIYLCPLRVWSDAFSFICVVPQPKKFSVFFVFLKSINVYSYICKLHIKHSSKTYMTIYWLYEVKGLLIMPRKIFSTS